MKKQGLTVLSLGILIVLLNHPVRALIIKYTLPELAARAEQVVLGEVIALKSRWNNDQEPIYTDITVSVKETWKGTIKTGTITIEQIGGEVGKDKLTIPDAAEFKTGTVVVLFIDRKEDFTDLAGWYQGKFTVKDGIAVQEKTGYKIPLDELKSIVTQYR
jgi:hypothetical protein